MPINRETIEQFITDNIVYPLDPLDMDQVEELSEIFKALLNNASGNLSRGDKIEINKKFGDLL